MDKSVLARLLTYLNPAFYLAFIFFWLRSGVKVAGDIWVNFWDED